MRSAITPLKEIALGSEGNAYVEYCLRQGTGLCSKVLDVLRVGGEAFAPLPEGVSLARAKRFEVGGVTRRRDMTVWLVGHLQHSFHGDSVVGNLVLQDIWAKPTDRFAKCAGLSPLFHDGNVYYLMKLADVNVYSVTEAMRLMKSFQFVAVYSRYSPSRDEPAYDDYIVESTLDCLASRSVRIFVGAYDQEGLVAWMR
jgi:hypothetical protein